MAMVERSAARSARRSLAVAGAFALALVLATCGSDGRSSLTAGGPGRNDPPSTQALAPGADDTTSTTVFEPRRFVVAASGDLLLHTRVLEFAQANAGGTGYDFDPMFAEIAPLISAADLALCHLEVPLSADNSVITDYPMFSGPREIVGAVRRAGYDGCSTASNHSLDKGFTGVSDTLSVFDDEGISQSGMARSAQESATPPIHDANGVAVGHLSYTYGLNGMPLPEPWMANLIDVDRILADAAAIRARGAEVVLVSMHWGNEYQHEPSGEQIAQAQALLASPDIDAIIGDHVHVVQPIDRINGKPVVYGMGNSLSNQTDPPNRRDGVIVYLTIVETTPGVFVTEQIAYTPTWVHYPGTIIRPVTAESVPESYQRSAANLGLLGTFDGPAIYDPAELR
jgi:hypothetical protein